MTTIPQFLIIGGQKCGTTAAARNLSLHPNVNIFAGVTDYGQKEIEFFNQHWDRGIDWYSSHFRMAEDSSNVLHGEKTAELFHRTICHERMFATNPQFKLIVFLRSPVERAYSQWKMAALHKGDETEGFHSVVERELNSVNEDHYRQEFYSCADTGLSCWREGYLLKGMYAEQLESLLNWFPREQVFISISERSRANMEKSYSEIFDFLKLPPFVAPFAEHFVGKPSRTMSSQTRTLLSELYQAPNERLFSLIGEEIPEWK